MDSNDQRNLSALLIRDKGDHVVIESEGVEISVHQTRAQAAVWLRLIERQRR